MRFCSDPVLFCALKFSSSMIPFFPYLSSRAEMGSPATTTLDWRLFLACLALAYVAFEQFAYWRKKRHLSGPLFVVPFVGDGIRMVLDPTRFWNNQALASKSSGLSCTLLFGKFVVFIRDSEMSQKIFANVRPDAFHLVGHPFGKKLFGDQNLIFMFGEEHKALRRRLAPLFSLKALRTYVSIQERIIRRHIEGWIKKSEMSEEQAIALRLLCRDMNLETSQTAFVGPYLTEEARKRFTEDYKLFNVGLMAVPVYVPGCAFYKATQAAKRLVRTLGDCARESKKMMAGGAEPVCLMDFCTVEILREMKEAEDAGLPHPRHTSDLELGQHVFDFLFAAQDASTSSLVWAVSLLESHPEVLAKVRAEQRSRIGHDSVSFSPELLREMKFTEMFVKEVLRFRPPATLVPHVASIDFPITDSYIIPRGSIVFPSLFESSFQGFPDPCKFEPERFSPERLEDQVYKRNWLVFGAGSHQCLGQRYAINQLTLFTSLFSTMVDFVRVRTPGCDEIAYAPTIVPKDGGFFHLSARTVP